MCIAFAVNWCNLLIISKVKTCYCTARSFYGSIFGSGGADLKYEGIHNHIW